MVELTLPEDSNIYASQYKLYLPDKNLILKYNSTRQMKDMSQIDLKFASEQNAFGLTDDFDDLYIPKKASRLQTAGFYLY